MSAEKGYNHTNSSEYEHHNEIRGSTSKRAFFQHLTVSIRENHIKKEVKPECTEIKKRRQ